MEIIVYYIIVSNLHPPLLKIVGRFDIPASMAAGKIPEFVAQLDFMAKEALSKETIVDWFPVPALKSVEVGQKTVNVYTVIE